MEDIIKLQKFFSELNEIEKKYPNTTKQFNIFRTLHKEHDETKLHSRFLAFLLSPEGSHQKGDTFLKLFLKTVEINDFTTDNAVVYPTEISSESHKGEFLKIDILIINRISKQAIIIENKIYAGDSNKKEDESNSINEPQNKEDKEDKEPNGQLARYFYRINKKENINEENIKVFYLTPNGHPPTKESLDIYETLERINGKLIDYARTIKEWLLCCKESIEQSFLKESINQYINLLEKMVGDINKRIEIKEIIGESEDNLNAARLLIDNWEHVRWHTIADFWDELASKLSTKHSIKSNIQPDKDYTATARCKDYDYGLEVNESTKIWNKRDKGLYLERNGEELKSFTIFLHDFSKKETFSLINKEFRGTLIREIESEIDQH